MVVGVVCKIPSARGWAAVPAARVRSRCCQFLLLSLTLLGQQWPKVCSFFNILWVQNSSYLAFSIFPKFSCVLPVALQLFPSQAPFWVRTVFIHSSSLQFGVPPYGELDSSSRSVINLFFNIEIIIHQSRVVRKSELKCWGVMLW